ncbi:hypothetical protein ALC60_07767, partial [Trachymyrmex zeteki]
TIIYSAGIITKRIAPPRHFIDTLMVMCETMPNIFSRIPVISLTIPWGLVKKSSVSLFLRRLLHPQVPWHVLLAANSAQSLAASESLGRPSCRFQVGAKYLQVEDTCKSKHSEGGKMTRDKSVHISPVNIFLINPFVRQIFLQATCNEASESRHNDILSISSGVTCGERNLKDDNSNFSEFIPLTVTIIMFITRNNNMQAGPTVINSSGRARFKKRIKKAGYRPGLNYR